MSDEPKLPLANPASAPEPAALLAELAHELRTPLAAILTLAEIFRDEGFGPLGNPRYREYAGDIFRAANHALAVVNSMLDRDVLAGGKAKIRVVPLDLGVLVTDCIAMTAPMARASGCSLIPVLSESPRVLADERTMRQIVLNLLANAIRMAQGARQVEIATSLDPAGQVRLSVSDSGPGMTEEDIARVLAVPPSLLVDQATRAVPGHGIGLPLVRALAIVNGASFGLAKRPAGGTAATITFPKERLAGEQTA